MPWDMEIEEWQGEERIRRQDDARRKPVEFIGTHPLTEKRQEVSGRPAGQSRVVYDVDDLHVK